MVDYVIFSLCVNFCYNLIENMNLCVSYFFGFCVFQVFDEDLYIENVGGIVFMIELVKDLIEEKL